MEEIRLSNKFALKLMNGLFKDISNQSFVIRWVSWCIDSRYRNYKLLNKFLE